MAKQSASKLIQLRALEFVDSLVPGRFALARVRVADECEYRYVGKLLRGRDVVDAFEESHNRAMKQVDSIEYLPSVIDSVSDAGVMVRVYDRIELNGKSHIHVDRLLVSVLIEGDAWHVTSIEHHPLEAEKTKLESFFAVGGPKKSEKPED